MTLPFDQSTNTTEYAPFHEEFFDTFNFGDVFESEDYFLLDDIDDLNHQVRRLSIDLVRIQEFTNDSLSLGPIKSENCRRQSLDLARCILSYHESAQQQQPVKKRVYDECAPEIRRITEVRANKKRASQYSQAGNDDSTAISRSSFNSSSPSILSLMSSDELAQQLERSALRLADSMKRSEESRSRVLKSEQTCEPDDAANQQSSSRSRSPFGLSSLVSSGIVSYVGHMTSSSTLY
eukprot:CAMPEP_0194077952 /NCGR_PEP_ID=MMETSP0149-20130528/4463_1 /TAXON_ID=122233 /ORGANISM="Chaetoceros debilis, Strain MM31A-1" /LENGTH=235 /DNA_ID=CAMNT_0038759105 /DNA_START=37 /DNA_END=744 /DNA_ORIENTATION=-